MPKDERTPLGMKKGGKVRLRYTVANAGATVGLVANQSVLSIRAIGAR